MDPARKQVTSSAQDEDSTLKTNADLKQGFHNLSGTQTTPAGTIIQIEEISEGVFRATTEKSLYVIEYDINKCIGAASCAAIAPLTFFMNEENKAELVNEGEWDEDDIILSAAQSCPVFAIKIIIKETNEVIFPIEDIY